MTHREFFSVAGHIFAVRDCDASKVWRRVHPAYEPFACDDAGSPALEVDIHVGPIDLEGLECMIDPDASIDGVPVNILPHTDASGALVIAVTQPGLDSPAAMVRLTDDFVRASIVVDERTSPSRPAWMVAASFTSAMQIAYMAATATADTLMSHASCVAWQGRAYLFIARSGTGKSTQSRMWLENIPGTELLNDDHPIVRIVDGVPTAFGSPWSGKTPCYKAMQAPIGGIARIVRAKHNRMVRQSPIGAYASLTASFSGLTFVPSQAEGRHRALEGLVSSVPCYELECLPDAEAARVCNQVISNSE